jgi:hypothetical protein
MVGAMVATNGQVMKIQRVNEAREALVLSIAGLQGFHEYIVGWPCRCCSNRSLGLYAVTAVETAYRNAPGRT